jgi:hypothetical protein
MSRHLYQVPGLATFESFAMLIILGRSGAMVSFQPVDDKPSAKLES